MKIVVWIDKAGVREVEVKDIEVGVVIVFVMETTLTVFIIVDLAIHSVQSMQLYACTHNTSGAMISYRVRL